MLCGMMSVSAWAESDIRVLLDGQEMTFDVPPQLVGDRTLVPVRAVAESLDCKVDWDDATSTVLIASGGKVVDDIYQYPNPVIDFAADDGTMSKLHCDLRWMFEQSVFPKMLFGNSDAMKDLIVNSPEKFLAFVDDKVWSECLGTVAMRYMMDSDEEFVISTEEDLGRYIRQIADEFSLHAYQSFDVDAVKLAADQYMILFSMADIYDSLKVDEMDKMCLSNYIAVVYNSTSDKLAYYLLERSLDSNCVLCSYDENMTHSSLAVVPNDKKSFVEGVALLSK